MDNTTNLALAGVVIGMAVVFYNTYIAPLVRANNLKRKYQSAAEPVIILQTCESDNEFWAKVRREQARYTDVGNAWALQQSPVIPFPFNATFSFQWFEKRMDVATVGLGQGEYLSAAKRQYDECLKEWQKQTGKEFGYDKAFTANGQKEFNKEEIWN